MAFYKSLNVYDQNGLDATVSFSFLFFFLLNGQTLLAMTHATKPMGDNGPDFSKMKVMEYCQFLVISIGTGSARKEKKFSAEMVNKWNPLGWVLNGSMPPIVEMFAEASQDMVDYHISVTFQALHSEANYLRIQVIKHRFSQIQFILVSI